MGALVNELLALGPSDFARNIPDSEVLVATDGFDTFEFFEVYGPALFARLVEVLRDGSDRDRMRFVSAHPLANRVHSEPRIGVVADNDLVRGVILEIFTSVGRLLAVSEDRSKLVLQDQQRGKAVHYQRVPDGVACFLGSHRFSYDPPHDPVLRDSQYRILDSDDLERHIEERIRCVVGLVGDIRSGSAPSRGVMETAGVSAAEGPLLWSEVVSRTIDPVLGPVSAGRVDRCLEGCGLVVLERSGQIISYKRVE